MDQRVRVDATFVLCSVPEHRNQPLTHVCLEPACVKGPLVCVSCMNNSHRKHRVLPIGEFQQEISNMKFDRSVTEKSAAHEVEIKELKVKKSLMFQKAKERILSRIDELERGVDQYVDGVTRQVEEQTARFNEKVAVPMGYDPRQPLQVVMSDFSKAVSNYLSNEARRRQLVVGIPAETGKLSQTFGLIEGYLEKISTQDSGNIKAFIKFMKDGGYVKCDVWEERPEYNNQRLISEIQYADFGKGPQKTAKSIWSSFWQQNRLKMSAVIALVVFLLAIGMQSKLTTKTVHLDSWSLLGKHKDLAVEQKNLKRTRVSDKGLWSCAAIDTQFNSNATVYSLSLYLSVLKENLAVGICFKGFIMSKYSLQPDNLAGKGCYFASTNGIAYSSWDNNINQRSGWKVVVGDTLRMTYRPDSNFLSFTNNGHHLINLETIRSKDYVAVVCFTENPRQHEGSLISIL